MCRRFASSVPGMRALAVWRRNFLVWRKLAVPSVLGNLADPIIYLFGLGYGLGSLLPRHLEPLGGVPYITFLAAGTICASTMNAASFETLYAAFSRMHVQKTWDAILNTPLALEDVLLGELLWSASKASLSGLAILAVAAGLGLVASPLALLIIPVIFVTGLAFSGLGLIVTALAPSYDFFMYYFTLLVTPMLLLCGVFFPIEQLPPAMRTVAALLPLSHAVELARPLMLGRWPGEASLHLAVLLATAIAAYFVALAVTRRRLLN